MKKALVTGISGQDGSYLAELLLGKGYEVHGVVRRSSSFNTERLDTIYQDPHVADYRLRLHYGDLEDGSSLTSLVHKIRPDEIYNLAAQSHVRVSFDIPEYTVSTVAMGTLRLLEAMRELGTACRFYQASSSEMYGSTPPPQHEETAFKPRSPYACAKVFAHQLCQNYRDAYGLHISCGILFNHESPRRGIPFVTRKITRAAARIKHGLDKKLYLGNLDAKRDWGFAGDYVEAMWMMLQQDKPDDYVIATGESYSVRDVLDVSFGTLGLDWNKYVEIDPRYLRPTEVDRLHGDCTKAREKLGWKPKMTFKELVTTMARADEEDVRTSLAGRLRRRDMKISIVTPSYNQAQFIERTIESVLSQEGDFELDFRVVDGGSTDGTVEILKRYGDRFAWSSERDRGQVDAINRGLRLATGDIIGWLNSDDVLLPGALQRIATQFAENPRTEWLHGRCEIIDEHDRRVRKWIEAYKHYRSLNWTLESFLTENFVSQMTVYWRRSAQTEIGLLSTSLVYAFDYDWILRLAHRGDPLYIEQPTACFRWYETTKSANGYVVQMTETAELGAASLRANPWIRVQAHAKKTAIINIYRALGLGRAVIRNMSARLR